MNELKCRKPYRAYVNRFSNWSEQKFFTEEQYQEVDRGVVSKKYELVTCHTARRSFATNGYLSDVPIRDLMRITGHKKENTFLNYVQVKREVKLSRILEIYPTELKKVG